MFAVISAGGTEFIKDDWFFMTGGIFISHMDCLPILLLGPWTHDYPSFWNSIFGNIQL
jgi:hypothetical protein